MRAHQDELEALFEALAYLLKESDPDGLEMYFTMTDESYRAKSSCKLMKYLKNHNPPIDRSNIRTRLIRIVGEYQRRLNDQLQSGRNRRLSFTRTPGQVRPQSLYVFTDGIWQPSSDITDIVENLVKSLTDHRLPPEQFGIQFIRFGNDIEGIERLARLDSRLNLAM